MADTDRLGAEVRTSFGKGAARKLRAASKIPAVIYGHGTEPQHVTLPGHETMLATRKANALLTLDIEGREQLALVKDVQRDPVRQIIEHIDLIVVRRGERVEVDVPVAVEGESAAGTIATLENTTLTVEAEATHIPERVTVDVTDLEDGSQILAASVPLPSGVTLVSDAEALVVGVSTPPAPELDDADAETDTEAEGDAEVESDEKDADES